MRLAVAHAEDLPPGSLKKVLVEGHPALVVGNAAGTIFALLDECNHGEADLSEGDLDGCEIVCPLHSGCFDVRTGKATRRPAKRPQPTYPVELEDGVVYVLVEAGHEAASSTR
jgi:3-phenylpropionate/trans-cinnamate dioxygenase ferredoxin component